MTMTPANSADVAATPETEAAWGDVLRDYRAALADQREAIERVREGRDGQDAPPVAVPAAFAPPAEMPLMPASMHAEAAALDAETAELLITARELLAQMRPPTIAAPVHRSILAPPRPSQMDT